MGPVRDKYATPASTPSGCFLSPISAPTWAGAARATVPRTCANAARRTRSGNFSRSQYSSKLGRDRVSCSALDHGQGGSQDSTYWANFPTVRICSGGHGEIVAEQFVGPVNQMDIHAALISLLQATSPYKPQAGNLEQLLQTQRRR
jgi:hypothetical protein